MEKEGLTRFLQPRELLRGWIRQISTRSKWLHRGLQVWLLRGTATNCALTRYKPRLDLGLSAVTWPCLKTRLAKRLWQQANKVLQLAIKPFTGPAVCLPTSRTLSPLSYGKTKLELLTDSLALKQQKRSLNKKRKQQTTARKSVSPVWLPTSPNAMLSNWALYKNLIRGKLPLLQASKMEWLVEMEKALAHLESGLTRLLPLKAGAR